MKFGTLTPNQPRMYVMNMWRNLFPAIALAFMLCLTGLAMSGEAQAERFVDNGNGTVTDTVTGLMWTKDANPIGLRNWHDAISACTSFSISGIGGWRLPTRDELVDIYHAIQGGHPFTRVQSEFKYYWSLTTYAHYTDYAWYVDMSNGFVSKYSKTFRDHVWCVRSGQ